VVASATIEPLRLRMSEVRKSYGATHALRGVSLEVRPGEIHALIGENGAGKSTLMKILSGAEAPDAGIVELDGVPFTPANPLHARRSGIAMIYQELNLAHHLSVEENITLGAEPGTFGWISQSKRRALAEGALRQLNCSDVPLAARISSLPIAQQQMVEIARALISRPRVLIMDEPTSSLAAADVEKLFQAVGQLREQGVSVIYISHFLEECSRLANRYTVLRDGQTVASGNMRGTAIPQLIHAMVGREMNEAYPRVPHTVGEPLLEVTGLTGQLKPRNVNFTLRKGEIFGIAGLIGAGRTETLRTLFGLDKAQAGEATLGSNKRVRFKPFQAIASGLGLLSENRKEEGLLLNRSLADNLTMTRLAPFSTAGLLNLGAQRRATATWMDKLQVRARDPQQPIRELSGGNQQKIAIGRLLHQQAEVLLLDEPTRGIDVGSKAEIYRLIGQLAAEGKAILFVSSYLPELLGICDTIGVMCRGQFVDIKPAESWTEQTLLTAAVSGASAGA
jgi:ribose transport system ATP-binding protein